ncbi:MAG: hypothetical protein V4621_05255 [Pseudomonadota bacterium]
MTSSNDNNGNKGSWLAKAGGFATGALAGFHTALAVAETQKPPSPDTPTAGQSFHAAAHTLSGTLHMGAEGQQGGPANDGEDRVTDFLDVGTESPNGGPNNDPDRAETGSYADSFDPPSSPFNPSPESPGEPDAIIGGGPYMHYDVGAESPNGGPNNDPDLTL